MSQVELQVQRSSSGAWRSCPTVSKVRSPGRFSSRGRMKRLAQPFPSGARTKADEQAVLAQEPQP
jgi:hypothetical protein